MYPQTTKKDNKELKIEYKVTILWAIADILPQKLLNKMIMKCWFALLFYFKNLVIDYLFLNFLFILLVLYGFPVSRHIYFQINFFKENLSIKITLQAK